MHTVSSVSSQEENTIVNPYSRVGYEYVCPGEIATVLCSTNRSTDINLEWDINDLETGALQEFFVFGSATTVSLRGGVSAALYSNLNGIRLSSVTFVTTPTEDREIICNSETVSLLVAGTSL